MADKKYEKAQYEHPIYGINWTAGIGRPTGIYWLDGASLFAVHGSLAEDELVARGAILMATLRFDGDPLEQSHRGRTVDTVPAHMLARRSAGLC